MSLLSFLACLQFAHTAPGTPRRAGVSLKWLWAGAFQLHSAVSPRPSPAFPSRRHLRPLVSEHFLLSASTCCFSVSLTGSSSLRFRQFLALYLGDLRFSPGVQHHVCCLIADLSLQPSAKSEFHLLASCLSMDLRVVGSETGPCFPSEHPSPPFCSFSPLI